jgi:cobalt-zinc-cadmium efflux system membrane fusion protein
LQQMMTSAVCRLITPGLAALGVIVAMNGCGQRAEHEHEHEEKTAQITVWTDKYEVFSEHQAVLVGKPTTFITHVTDLHTREPRRSGPVAFVLKHNGSTEEHPVAEPARAGIYLPEIVFPQVGDWGLTLLVPTDGTNAVVDLGTIKVYQDDHAAAHADIPDAPEGVSFLKEQQWKILSETRPVERRQLVERARLPARVRAKPGHSATVIAPMSGQLISGGSVVHPGQQVKAGELLAVLRPSFSEAAARLADADAAFKTAKATMDQAEATFARTRQLAAEKAKSERELQEAELALALARARYAAASGLLATFRQSGEAFPLDAPPNASLVLELRAPIAGVIQSVAAGPGELVAADAPIFTLLDSEFVWIEAQVPIANVPRIRSAADAAVELPGAPGEFVSIGNREGGGLVSLGMTVDSETHTVPLIFEVPNPKGTFLVGQSVLLYVATDHAEDALAVPESALVEEGGQLIAFVQVSGETFQKREITQGIRDTGFVQVVHGLKEGERVVTSGAYAIRLSSISGVIPAHGHAH